MITSENSFLTFVCETFLCTQARIERAGETVKKSDACINQLTLIRLTDTSEKMPNAYGDIGFRRVHVPFNLYKSAVMAGLPSNAQ